MFLPDATKGITAKNPVLFIVYYSLFATCADAGAVQAIIYMHARTHTGCPLFVVVAACHEAHLVHPYVAGYRLPGSV
jgi:hypothetical protein